LSALSLGLSASGGPSTVAIRDTDGAVHVGSPGRGDDLAAQVEALFQDVGAQPSALTEVRLDLGPGSYTGLRIAVTFARTLHTFLGVPVLTTTSLQLMALAAWREGRVSESQRIRPVLDARRNRFHHALVELAGGVRLVEPPRAVSYEELLASVGSQEALLAEKALQPMLSATVTTVPFTAELLFDDALRFSSRSGDQLEPLYLMGSYAE
jgi:tRNA threonylcarbamoyl adenosine modification protein YeaZ